MNIERIFIGYNKNGERCLLYKKEDYYIDLNNKQKYFVED